MPATLSQVSISLAVTVVATIEVVPWRATVAAMISSASAVPSITSCPPAPWMWTSTKPGHDGLSPCRDFARAARQYHRAAPAHGGDLASLNDHYGIGNLFERSECAVGVDGNRLHRSGIILS